MKKRENLFKTFLKDQTGGTSIILIIVIIFIVILLSFGAGFGFGKGTGKGAGNGDGEGTEYTPSDDKVETASDVKPSTLPTITSAPKEFSVVVERTEILFDNEKFSNAQSLIDIIQKKVETDESILIILHDEDAIANTLEDVKNALDRNGISWVTPTPVPTSEK